jgi:hypothetical protein
MLRPVSSCTYRSVSTRLVNGLLAVSTQFLEATVGFVCVVGTAGRTSLGDVLPCEGRGGVGGGCGQCG